MRDLRRRDALTLFAALSAALLAAGPTGLARADEAGRGQQKLARLVLHGVPATPSVVLARLVESGALAPLADTVELAIWRTPDQMRAGVVSGAMTLFVAPTYSCANMRNRGVPIRQVNVLTWGLLYLMSRDQTVRRIEDIAGKTVLVAFRNDAPDLIVRLVLRRLGLDPDRDVTLQYVGSSTEAAQLFLAGRGDLAALPEPAATATEIRAAKEKLPIHRAVDVTEAYGRLTGRPAGIPQAGLAVRDDFLQAHPEIVAAVHRGCVDSAHWVATHMSEAGALGAARLNLPAPVVARSIPHFRLNVVSAAEARLDLERYFSDLMEMSPAILGGNLPDDAFYWGPG
ncbi:ABC-type sulfonate transport system periplasmic component [Rhodovulum sp. PH10]|uniref:ABC transporter substrate-binding protein n=1 Tax=Rhodovulum sp. PH10 TaxID=1187851 RepID=UPI00027C29EA|nr:PhnD/SsuA/transferrin family substrate-binding protein [Rhodovulum sp. PH10]EJW12623.1 ABC-type sulfonate transport system periplasmic component [Rhodovulum sp. PH10]